MISSFIEQLESAVDPNAIFTAAVVAHEARLMQNIAVMNPHWLTANHEAAHAVVNHALGVRLVRLFADPNDPTKGVCEPDPVYEAACGDNDLPHPMTDPQGHAWCVLVARRHATAALAGVAMEEILSAESSVGPTAEEVAYDFQNATENLQLAFKYIPMLGEPHVPEPNIDNALASSKHVARNILEWSSSRTAVDKLAQILLKDHEILGPEVIGQIIEASGVKFAAAFPAFCASLRLTKDSE